MPPPDSPKSRGEASTLGRRLSAVWSYGRGAPDPKDIENLNIKRTELTEVYCHDDPQVDVVLVHGLNGHPQASWTAKNDVFWPTQLLPRTLGKVRARVLVYGYNADVYAFGGRSATSDYILQHAQTLVMTLDSERYGEDASERPIIFVAHSLGGILVKKALEYSSEITNVNNENLRSVFVSTFGIIFLGTPHNGADPAMWGQMVQSMCAALLPKKMLDTQPQLVTALKVQSETLQNINVAFTNIMDKFNLAFFHEAVKTDFGLFKDFVVDQTSAAPIMPGPAYAGIEATHSGMCKFESKNAPGYTSVASTIKRYAQEAPPVIAHRWAEERQLRRRVRLSRAHELTVSINNHVPPAGPTPLPGADASTAINATPSGSRQSLRLTDRAAPDSDPAQPLFIAPSGYRPNAIFVGMQRELSELDRSLLDPATRDKGTACVLLCGLSGGGKSHLARQYVYTRRHLFPGGIFWVRAKSKTEIAQGFWDIAQKAALKDVQDPASARFEQDTEVFVKTVKTWFEARQEWLLVFDGVSIDGEAELAALQAFLPDSRNSSVILTSVDKSLGGRHRLLNPVSVRVMPLSEENSRQLLFEELNIKKPSKAQVEKATELAQKVGGLPLAIHAIGHRVRETQEPLVKYHIRPYSSDPKLREPFIEIMEDLDRLQHYQARDLAYILCFFREHIPVEMIQLGVKALRPFRVEVKARNSGSRPELNTTFGILMRYALIDRNDTDDGASQRSGGSGGSGAVESIDTLKMHSVVQTFLCEMLKGSGWLPIWLTYAVKVYCFSFREADGRIKKGAGLIKDYREYENHGARLMEHLQRNLVKSAELAPVRDELDRVLRALRESVRELTPELLHEAIGSHYYKVSVFDRTSSSSSAGPETPQMSTADLPAFGLPGMDSPAPFFSDAPRPEVVKYSPRAPYQGEDAGYLSDLDQPGRQKGFPGQEPSRPSRLGTEVDEEEWETASRRRKGKRTAKENQPPSHRTLVGRQRRRYRDSVNAWRIIEPSRLQPHVTRINVPRTDSPEIRSASRGAAGRTSEAELTLASFHRGSPPTRHALSPPQSFANALSGRTSPAPAQTGDGEQHTPSAGQATPMRRGRSGESPHSVRSDQGPSHHQFSPPLPGSALPVPPNRTPQGSTHSSPGPHYPDPMQSSDPDLRNLPGLYVNDRRYYHGQHRQPAVHGRNPDPLPFEDVSTGGKRQLPTDFHGHRRHQTLSSSMHNTRGSEYALSSHPDVRGAYQQPALAGYSSQPMSRNVSAQSVPTHPSVTDTEPARFPPEFSPASPRGRFRDGAPMRKSPKLGAAQATSDAMSPLEEATPRYVHELDLSAMGGWQGSPPTTTAMSMSRSSSGPGIAAQGTLISFGDHEPIEIGLAELRSREERERFEAALKRGAFRPMLRDPRRPPPLPYPPTSVMPRGGSDVRSMAEEAAIRGRRRGLSSPAGVNVGLGVDLGGTRPMAIPRRR